MTCNSARKLRRVIVENDELAFVKHVYDRFYLLDDAAFDIAVKNDVKCEEFDIGMEGLLLFVLKELSQIKQVIEKIRA